MNWQDKFDRLLKAMALGEPHKRKEAKPPASSAASGGGPKKTDDGR